MQVTTKYDRINLQMLCKSIPGKINIYNNNNSQMTKLHTSTKCQIIPRTQHNSNKHNTKHGTRPSPPLKNEQHSYLSRWQKNVLEVKTVHRVNRPKLTNQNRRENKSRLISQSQRR